MSECIERDEAIAEIDDAFPVAPSSEFSKGVAVGVAMARLAVCRLPAADVRENKPGKWERTSHKSGYGYRCSECGAIYNKRKSRLNYCPNCGAEMKGEADEKQRASAE